MYLFLASLQGIVYSQTLSVSGYAPVAGDSLLFQTANYADPGPPGTGQVWDFSHMVNSGKDFYKAFYLPANLPAETSDPVHHSNLAYRLSGSWTIQNNYLLSDSTGVYDLGYGERIWYATNITNIDWAKIPLLKFPFQYLDTATRQGGYYTKSSPPSMGYSYGWKTILKADGTGTLITPCGVYPNTIRLNRITLNSSRHMSSSGGSHTTYDTTQTYEWYSPGIHGAVLSISSSTTYYFWGKPQFTYRKSAVIYNDHSKIPLGLHEANGTNFGLSFQNPVVETLNLELQSQGSSAYTMEIFDLTGKQLFMENLEDGKLELDLSSISTGMYILQVKNQEGLLERRKFILQKN
jgi:hypothetical protein